MDFQSAMETFAEAWVAANVKGGGSLPETQVAVAQSQALALTRNKSPTSNNQIITSDGHGLRDGLERPSSPTTLHINPESDRQAHSTQLCNTTRNHELHKPSKEDDSNSTTAKSLPVHCVVESTGLLQEACLTRSSHWRRRVNIEIDSYVIIPTATAFQDIVAAALQRLGYPGDALAMARGAVVIKNWKPLSLDLISDNNASTVGEVLGELTTVATLRITVLRPLRLPGGAMQPPILAEMRDKLLRLLILQSHGILRSSGCPLDEVMLSHICRGSGHHVTYPEPTSELIRKFDAWFAAQVTPNSTSGHLPNPTYIPSFPSRSPVLSQSPRGIDSNGEHVHPALQTVHSQYPNQKTRMRTSFDPELELPKLQRWFMENQHPSRQQIQSYVRELNNLESRRGRKPLDINNVVYWFKNARAAQKRAELRGSSLACHLGMNGYNDNHSPLLTNDAYNRESPSANCLKRPLSAMSEDNLSNNGSDDETAEQNLEERPVTPDPDLPLSLITKKSQEELQISDEIKIEPTDLRRHTSIHSLDNHDLTNNNKLSLSDQEDSEVDMDTNAPSVRTELPVGSFRSTSPLEPSGGPNRDLAFPLVPNSMFSHSIMYMSHYIPNLSHPPGNSPPGGSGLNLSALSEDRRKRNRTFIDPVTEVPRLEQWFQSNTHPSHNLILKYTEELNRMPYRQKFPRLESKNVQFWFKNRRAKCKRMKMSLYDSPAPLPLPRYE